MDKLIKIPGLSCERRVKAWVSGQEIVLYTQQNEISLYDLQIISKHFGTEWVYVSGENDGCPACNDKEPEMVVYVNEITKNRPRIKR